jgi:hypothetical protein
MNVAVAVVLSTLRLLSLLVEKEGSEKEGASLEEMVD